MSNTIPGSGVTGFEKPGGEARPSAIRLVDTAGVAWYLWVDTTGDLRIDAAADCEAAGYNWASSGTVVGAQQA